MVVKSSAVQFTSLVNLIAKKGMSSRTGTASKMQISRMFLFITVLIV